MKVKSKFLKWLLRIKEEVPPYPYDFIIIDYSPVALKYNILDEQNKVIYRYTGGKVKKYRYSEARLKALQGVYSLPVFDKTKFESTFPVFAKILPGEVEYVA